MLTRNLADFCEGLSSLHYEIISAISQVCRTAIIAAGVGSLAVVCRKPPAGAILRHGPSYANPYGPIEHAQRFFGANPEALRWSAFLFLGSAVPLGIFSAHDREPAAFSGGESGGPVYLRQIFQGVGGNLRMHVRTVRLQHGRFRSDLHFLRLSAELKLCIQADHIILVHEDVRCCEAAKSLFADLDPVGARGYGHRVGALDSSGRYASRWWIFP
jgi:hypothetical protein